MIAPSVKEDHFHGLLPTYEPGAHRIDGELKRLLLDVAKGGPVHLHQHVGRHPKHARNLGHLELARLEKLSLLRCHTHLCPRHAFFDQGHAVLTASTVP